MLREKGEVGSILNGLLHFPLGALIVSFHNVWHGIPLVVTIMGWGLVKEPGLSNVSKTRDANVVAGQRGKVLRVCCCRSGGDWTQRIDRIFVAQQLVPGGPTSKSCHSRLT
jgi:hypothetical protein